MMTSLLVTQLTELSSINFVSPPTGTMQQRRADKSALTLEVDCLKKNR
jgi:hypothetical protein